MRGCDFCKGKSSTPATFGDKRGEFYMSDFMLNFTSPSVNGSMNVKYCPMCKHRMHKLR